MSGRDIKEIGGYMNKRLPGLVVALAGVLGALALPGIASAGNIGYMEMCGGSQPAHANAIIAAGHTPVAVPTPDAASLSGLSALSVTNCDNGGHSTSYTAHLAAITAAVNSGMTLIMHDRRVTNAGSVLPGGAGLVVAGQTFGNTIDIPAGSPILSGPGGTLTDASLDGGNFSTHGYSTALPTGGSILANTGNTAQGVTVQYPFGAGKVVYSSIPLDFYLSGNGNNPPRDNLVSIYLPNLLAASLGDPFVSCRAEGFTGPKLTLCQQICEIPQTPSRLSALIRVYVAAYREDPPCGR
jgi:hypothetical protein